MFLCAANAPLALDKLVSTSLSESPSVVVLLPRYTNSLTYSTPFSLMVSGFSVLALIFITFVFLILMFNPSSFPFFLVLRICFGCLDDVVLVRICHQQNLGLQVSL